MLTCFSSCSLDGFITSRFSQLIAQKADVPTYPSPHIVTDSQSVSTSFSEPLSVSRACQTLDILMTLYDDIHRDVTVHDIYTTGDQNFVMTCATSLPAKEVGNCLLTPPGFCHGTTRVVSASTKCVPYNDSQGEEACRQRRHTTSPSAARGASAPPLLAKGFHQESQRPQNLVGVQELRIKSDGAGNAEGGCFKTILCAQGTGHLLQGTAVCSNNTGHQNIDHCRITQVANSSTPTRTIFVLPAVLQTSLPRQLCRHRSCIAHARHGNVPLVCISRLHANRGSPRQPRSRDTQDRRNGERSSPACWRSDTSRAAAGRGQTKTWQACRQQHRAEWMWTSQRLQ